MKKQIAVYMVCAALMTAGCMPVQVSAQAADSMQLTQAGQTDGQTEENNVDTSTMEQGVAEDLAISGVSIPATTQAGDKATVSFTVDGKKNTINGISYQANVIQKICPVIDSDFPFVTDNAAYTVTEGTAGRLACSYTFTTKDTLETGYYPVTFTIVYTRKAGTATDAFAGHVYYVNKTFNVKVKAAPAPTTEAATETEAADADVTMDVKKAPEGTYGKSCSVSFTVKSAKYKITSVAPVINETFPFETNGDAYKTISAKGTSKLACKYAFTLREDVATGYQPVSFVVMYLKNKKTCTVTKTINIKTTGKKPQETTEANQTVSTPRLLVTGYDTDTEKIGPNSTFKLTLHFKNTAKKVISNIKISLSTAEGEFLPVSGASTAFIDSMAAGDEKDIEIDMKAAAGLSNKPYQITVKSEYEDAKANPFTAEDSVSIPVVLEDRISLTEIVTPENLEVGKTGEISFTINNLGGASLRNVSVSCKGNDFTAEDSFVGNIASGTSGYASVMLNGVQATKGDGKCTLVISYENTDGEVKTYEQDVNVYVMQESVDAAVAVQDKPDQKQKSKVPYVLGGIVLAIAAIVIFVKIRKNKLAKEEEELMDDDVL